MTFQVRRIGRKRRRNAQSNHLAPATVRVRGEGFAEVAHDAARVSVGMVVADPSLPAARESAAAQATAIIAAAKAAGIPPGDLQTSDYRVNPVHRRDQTGAEPQAITGYEVRNSVSVTVRTLDLLGDLLDAAGAAGANQITGPEFFVQHPETAEAAARQAAMASARRRAETLAAAEGMNLGRVLSIAEGEEWQAPMPRMAIMAKADVSPSTPIESGTERIAAAVEVTWELVPTSTARTA